MNKFLTTDEMPQRRRKCMTIMLVVTLSCLFACLYTSNPYVFADSSTAMVEGIIEICAKIALVVGVM